MSTIKSKSAVNMTAKDRDALAVAIRARPKVAKDDVDARAATLTAETERQLSQTFSREDERWSDPIRETEQASKAADAELAARCKARGIRDEFRPRIVCGYLGRGENASRERRTELRRLATARIEAMSRDAKHRIEAWAAETHITLLAGGLQSGEAKTFLESMPTAVDLLPAPTMREIDALATTPSLRLIADEGADDLNGTD